MMFKNSVRLLSCNFALVWKVGLYKLIVCALCLGLVCVALGTLSTLNSFEGFKESFLNFLYSYNFSTTPLNQMSQLWACVTGMFAVVGELVVASPLIFIYLIFVIFFILPYLWHLSDYAAGETMYGFMSSQSKVGFTSAFFEKLNIANRYSLMFTAFAFVFNIIVVAGVIGILFLATIGGLFLYVCPVLVCVWLLVMYGLRITFTSGWLPAVVIQNNPIIKGWQFGYKVLCKRFFRMLSTSIVTVFIVMALVSLMSTFGLVVILPVLSVFICILSMVMFYSSQGMRFYVDYDNILTPRRLAETDKITKLKNII